MDEIANAAALPSKTSPAPDSQAQSTSQTAVSSAAVTP